MRFLKGFTSLEKDNIIAFKKKYNQNRPKEKHKAFCWAPFTSLRFHRNGCVQVCCHHIDYFSLKGRTLKEIWFGPELKAMRKQMLNFDIPASCNFCKSNFLNQNFSNVNALSFDHHIPAQNKFPVFMDFSLENTCNLACIMCDASLSSSIQKKKHIPARSGQFTYDENFLNQLDEFILNLKGAIFTGGEPFLIDTNYKIWDKMIKLNPAIDVFITTNGTIWNNKVEELLNKGHFNITVSIDSFTKEIYEKIRMGASFDKTMSNISKFSEYCNNKQTQFSVTICPLKDNAFEIPDIVKKCNQENWVFSFNIVIKPWYLALWSMYPNELTELNRFYQKVIYDNQHNNISEKNINRFNSYIELIQTWQNLVSEISIKKLNDPDICTYNKNVFRSYLISSLNKDEKQYNVSEKIIEVLEKIPDLLFVDPVFKIITHTHQGIIRNEFLENDIDTIAEHLTLVLFNALVNNSCIKMI